MLVEELKTRLLKIGLPCEQEFSQVTNAKTSIYFICNYGSDKNEISCLMKGEQIAGINVNGPQAEALKDFCLNELNKEKWMEQLEMYPCPACGKNTLEPQCPIDNPEFYIGCTNCNLCFPASESLNIPGLFVVYGGEYASHPLCKVKIK